MRPKGPEKRVPPLWAVQVLNTALFKQNIGKNQLWEKWMFENFSGCNFSILHLIHWQGTLQKGVSNNPEPCLTTCNWPSCATLNSSTVCGYISHSSILQDAQAIGKIWKMVTMLKIAETFYRNVLQSFYHWQTWLDLAEQAEGFSKCTHLSVCQSWSSGSLRSSWDGCSDPAWSKPGPNWVIQEIWIYLWS